MRYIFTLFILLVATSYHIPLHARDLNSSELVLVGSSDTKQSKNGRLLFLIYSEVAKRLNRKLVYRGYPAKRASMLSDKALAHGEIHRVPSYSDAHPSMIKVEEPHFSIEFYAYTYHETLKLKGWKSLNNKGFSVGYRAGVKRSKAQLEKLTLAELTKVPDNKTGLSMLGKHRFDVFVDVKDSLENTIKTYPQDDLIYPAGIIEKLNTHAFVHKKYQYLAPKIAEILKQLKEEGLIDKYKELSAEPNS